MASSTAFGQRGWFCREYVDPKREWSRYNVQGTDCRRLTTTFLAKERRAHGERWYKQEYLNDFASPIGSVFSEEDIEASFGRVSEAEAWNDLWGGALPEPNVVDAQPLEW